MPPLIEDILRKDGLSLKMLEELSFHSNMNINLKKNYELQICPAERHMMMVIEEFMRIFN